MSDIPLVAQAAIAVTLAYFGTLIALYIILSSSTKGKK